MILVLAVLLFLAQRFWVFRGSSGGGRATPLPGSAAGRESKIQGRA